ncbi:MAG: gamma-glutamyltransferase, partial [Hyphomicrobiales bacterium]|nr:gamma-glutamyltransferase [Hyphomicrobiales bacterium]
ECRATSSRNGGRHHRGIPGGFRSEQPGGIISEWWAASPGISTLEPMVDHQLDADLTARGHKVVRSPRPLGGCQAVWIDHERDVLLGASDTRKDGMALAI